MFPQNFLGAMGGNRQIEDAILNARPLPPWMSNTPDADGGTAFPRAALQLADPPGSPPRAAPEVSGGRGTAVEAPAGPLQVPQSAAPSQPPMSPSIGGRPTGNAEVRTVQAQDPFKVLPGRVVQDRTLSDGTIIPGEFFGPGQASMTSSGFTPGLMQVGGESRMLNSPSDYLTAVQHSARINGINPNTQLEALLGGFRGNAQQQNANALAAQQQNTQVQLGGMVGDTQRSTAQTEANSRREASILDAQGKADATRMAAMTAFLGGYAQNPAGMAGILPQIGALMSSPAYLNNLGVPTQGGAPQQGTGPGRGEPSGPPPAPQLVPGGIAAPAGHRPPAAAAPPQAGGQPPQPGANPANPIADMIPAAQDAQFVQGLRSAFGEVGAGPTGQQTFTPHKGGPQPHHINDLIGRLAGSTPKQQQAVAAAIRRGEMGDPAAVTRAIAIATAGGYLVAQPPRRADNGQPANLALGDPNQLPGSYSIPGEGGRPLFTLNGQNEASGRTGAIRALGRHFAGAGAVPYTSMTLGNGQVIPVSPTDLYSSWDRNPLFGGQAVQDSTYRNRAAYGGQLLQYLTNPQ